MPIYPGLSDSQKKVPPLPPSVASRSDSGSNRDFDNGATFLTFNPTNFDGKLPIIEYVVTAVSETNETVTATVSNLASFVLTGLKSGVKYRYKIKARNAVFDSDDSPEVGPDTATTVPGRPTSLTAINLGNGGGITLNWVAPANGGKPITSYTITPTVGSPIVTNTTSTTYSFTGTVGTTYNFTVKATNENGTGLDSTASGTVIPTAPAPPPPPPPPPSGGGAISNPLAFNSITGSGSVGISSGIYGVSLSFAGNASTQSYSWSGPLGSGASGNGSSANGFVSGISCDTPYTFTVVIYSGTNQTGFSLTQTVSATATCVGGGGPTTAPTCSPSNNNCGSSPCSDCDPARSTTGIASVSTTVCPSGRANVYTLCWTGGTCPNTSNVFIGCYVEPSQFTYCPSLGYSVAISGYPCNCPGASGCNPPPSPPTPPPTSPPIVVPTPPTATPTCAGPCLGTWSIVNGVCRCNAPAPTTPPTPPPPPSSSCFCRDFRGRCLSQSNCIL